MLGVTYKTAWFMAHGIREAMNAETNTMLGGPGSSGVVEADEPYWGNITDEDGNKKDATSWLRPQDEDRLARASTRDMP